MLERFVAEYSEPAFHFAYRLCGDVEEAKELVQEAFFKMFKNWESYDAALPIKAYFYTILKNLYADGVRRDERRPTVSLSLPVPGDGEDMSFGDNLPDKGGESPLDHCDRRDQAERVRLAVEGLPEGHRAILTLCDLQGLRYEEIAKVMDCPLGTVRSRVSRARLELRAKLLQMSGGEVNAYAL